MNRELFAFIAASPTPYHTVKTAAKELDGAGYCRLSEGEKWDLAPNRAYYAVRNGSSLIAFRTPERDFDGFLMTASHGDSPCFKIKDNPELAGDYTRLSVEKYGGMLCSTWLDRPLSVAGRVTVRDGNGMRVETVDLGEPCAIIPNVAIHMNREANTNVSYNPAVDMLPLWGISKEEAHLIPQIAKKLGIDEKEILSFDLYVYNPEAGTEWNGLISAPRLDDLQCAYATLKGFLNAEKSVKSLPVYCLFDNEEVGSRTKQGAASTFLRDVLERICASFGADLRQKLPNSFLLSCDNAHAVHPNHPEYKDPNHTVYPNRGIVIKHNANQNYTTDAVSAALFRLICEEANVPVQDYANRADIPGGGTLGNIANTQVAVNTVDIGLAQLAMHSSYETAGAEDTESLIRAAEVFFAKSLRFDGERYRFE